MLEQIREFWDNFVLSGCIATFCGALSYLLKVTEGKRFRFGEFILQMVISGACGMGCYAVIRHIDSLAPDTIGACCGLAGWMGANLIKLLELKVTKRIEQ